MRKVEKRSDCPISYSLDLLGDKWIMLVLRDIALNDKHFYKDFLEAGEGIATNVLSDRLKILESYEIIQSKPYDLNRTMKYYSITEKGIELIPIIIELWVWGAKHNPDTTVSKKDLKDRLTRKEETVAEYIMRAKNPN
ncbi:MAG: helix-turn-helix domain-containing protein [Bacteroidota bacterium]